jgi:hypothetical protein
MDYVLDYSWDRPDPSWTKRSGFTGVLRYISDTPGSTGKKLTPPELAALHAHGLAVGACWQETHDALTLGAAGGRADGAKAKAAMQALRAPAGAAVYFAADSDTVTAEHAIAYLTAARRALAPYAIGLYGGYDVITGVQKALPGQVYWWQTAAWSTDKIAPGIHLYQGVHRGKFAGGTVDVNTAYVANWGQWSKPAG